MCQTASRYFCGCCFDYTFWTHPFYDKETQEWYLACQHCYNHSRKGYLSMAEEFKADKDLYVKWLQEAQVTISSLPEEREARLNAIAEHINSFKNMIFEGKAKIAPMFEELDKINGRKGLSPQFRMEREKLITDPNIDVNFEPTAPKKPKETKEQKASKLNELLGIDPTALKEAIAAKRREKEEAAKAGK